MVRLSLFLLGIWASRVASQIFSDAAEAANFKAFLLDPENHWDRGTDIAFVEDEDAFANVTEHGALDSLPACLAVITPAVETDVVRAVNILREHRLQFLASDGCDGYATPIGALQNSIAVDLSKFNSVKVNKQKATLTVGGGVRTKDIIEQVGEAGLELPLDGCSCSNLVDITLGGGVSAWIGTRGLLIDALISLRVVTANGRVVDVSEKVNADLFWAMRGAGINFGIVVSATYKLYPSSNKITTIEGQFPLELKRTYYETLATVVENMDARLSIKSIISFDTIKNAPVIKLNCHFLGPVEEALELIAPLLDLGTTVLNTHAVSWTEFQKTALFDKDSVNYRGDLPRHPYGALTKSVPVEALIRSIDTMSALYRDYPATCQTDMVFHSYGIDASEAIPSDATAFPWRDAVSYSSTVIDPKQDKTSGAAAARAAKKIRADLGENSGYDSLATYLDFAHGDESVEQVFGSNTPRLVILKRKWDPQNLFKCYFSLLPIA